MDIKQYSSNSFSFIGDAVYTLHVREFFINKGYQASKTLQYLCNKYNSARGQLKAYEYLSSINYFSEEEITIYKRGRNNIRHIPKNGDKHSYEVASGLEAVAGYLYLTNKERLEDMFKEIFEGVKDYE